MDDRPSFRQEPAICIQGLSHSFGVGQASLKVLLDVQLEIQRGELVILMGPSGSGKTTLLTIVGCLRSLQEGSVKLLGNELKDASERQLMLLRRHLGFIFQSHNLHESLTAIQNVRMGLDVQQLKPGVNRESASRQALEMVGLSDRIDYLPAQLSGGQKQRVAVARALVGNPEIVFADEPMAALDIDSGRKVVRILRQLADQRGTTTLMVTHDHRILDLADRIVKMEDGRVIDAAANVTTYAGE